VFVELKKTKHHKPIRCSASDFTDLFVFLLTPLWNFVERTWLPHSLPEAWDVLVDEVFIFTSLWIIR
jgi:hypothetical protein